MDMGCVSVDCMYHGMWCVLQMCIQRRFLCGASSQVSGTALAETLRQCIELQLCKYLATRSTLELD